MSLLDKFAAVEQLKSGLTSAGKDPTNVVFDSINSATEAVVEGRTTILAGTNNYLGLTFDPDCVAAGVAALTRGRTALLAEQVDELPPDVVDGAGRVGQQHDAELRLEVEGEEATASAGAAVVPEAREPAAAEMPSEADRAPVVAVHAARRREGAPQPWCVAPMKFSRRKTG